MFNPKGFQAPSQSSPSYVMGNGYPPFAPYPVTSLARSILEQGFNATESDRLTMIITSYTNATFSALKEADIAQVLGMMAATHDSAELAHRTSHMAMASGRRANSRESWNYIEFVNYIISSFPYMNWEYVIQSLDYHDFSVHDDQGAAIIIRSYAHATGHPPSDFPIYLFFKSEWTNVSGQLSFLEYALTLPLDIIPSFIRSATRLIVIPEELESAPGPIRNAMYHLYTQPWNNLDMLEYISHLLLDPAYQEEVHHILEIALRQCPELLCLGLAILQVHSWPTPVPLLCDLLIQLITAFLGGQSGSMLVLPRLWRIHPSLMVHSMSDMYSKEPTSISHLLDIAQELRILLKVIDSEIYPFVFEMAALASRREHLNLEKWLNDNIQTKGEQFRTACIQFLQNRGKSDKPIVPLSQETVAIFSRVLSSQSVAKQQDQPLTAKETEEIWAKVLAGYHQLPEISAYFQSSFPQDMEAHANAYYEKVYSQEFEPKDLVKLMFKLSSGDSNDTTLLSCLIHSILDEFRFFPNYPDKELHITGVLLGYMLQIHGHILSEVCLGVALRFIHDALCLSMNPKLVNFASVTILQYASNQNAHPLPLFFWKKLSGHKRWAPEALLTCISSFCATPGTAPEKKDALLRFFPESDAADRGSKTKGTFQCIENLTISDELAELQELYSLGQKNDHASQDTSALKEKILFLMNNLSVQNVSSKGKEWNALLEVSLVPWLSEYLITHRISVEPNFHAMYLSILDMVDDTRRVRNVLHEHLLLSGYLHAHALLQSDKTAQSSTDRSLLKNLGIWIGKWTLGRNRPILHRHLPLVELLREGYQADRLLVVLPFTCKLLEGCSSSSVFQPAKHPWVTKILSCLTDLYYYTDLKLNLKFEIEVLCKNLGVALEAMAPGADDTGHHSPPFFKPRPSLWETDPELHIETASQSQQEHVPVQSAQEDENEKSEIPGLSKNIAWGTHPLIQKRVQTWPIFRQVVIFAMEFAIREVGPVVVDRSVAIAKATTIDLIQRDFRDFLSRKDAQSSSVVKKASSQMMQHLTGNLVLGTTKDPLRNSMMTHLTWFSQLAGWNSSSHSIPLLDPNTDPQQLFISILTSIVDANMDLACAYIEKAAIKRAIPEIQQSLSGLASPGPVPSFIPEALRASSNGLTPIQLKLYDDFVRISRLQNLANLSIVSIPALSQSDFDRVAAILKPQYPIDTEPANTVASVTTTTTAPSSIEQQFLHTLVQIDKLISSHPNVPFSSFPSNHELRTLMKQILILALNSPNRDEVCILFSQKIIHILYKSDSILGIEVHVVLLDKLCELSARVTREVTSWVIYANDERKYNVSVTVAFFLSGLMNVLEYDIQLAKHLVSDYQATNSHDIPSVEFACSLVRRCVLMEPVVAAPFDFSETCHSLQIIYNENPSKAEIGDLLKEVSVRTALVQSQPLQEVQDQVAYYFQEWMRLCQVLSAADKSFSAFVHQVFRQGFFRHPFLSQVFFSYSIQLAISEYQQKGNSYSILQRYSKWIAYIIRCFPTNAERPGTGKIQVLKVFLLDGCGQALLRTPAASSNTMALILSALLYEWHAQERNMEPEAVYELSHTMASFLHVIRPELLPEFAFGWLELASHRFLFPNLLSNRKGENDGWEMVRILVLDAIRFFSSLLSSGNINTGSVSATSTISNTVKVYYRGVMCWALLLLHDYSEFISYYAFDFISEIPIFCVQLKNLLLSAFPPHLKLMDPFSPNLNIDQLPESEQEPVMSDLAWADSEWWKQFLGTGANTLQGWRQQWKGMEKHIPERSTSDKSWKRGLMRWAAWLVWYIAKERKESVTSFLVFLTVDILMEDERYYLYQSMANHLRYPNAHTAYYHHMLLYLFRSAPEQSTIREQVTRVLLERLTVNRPHPWGLLVTFIELIRNPVYDFWSYGFTHSSPDMERLFESVARSCMIRRGVVEDGSIVR